MGSSPSKPSNFVPLSLDPDESNELYKKMLEYDYGSDNKYTKDYEELFKRLVNCKGKVIYQENMMYAVNNNPSKPVIIQTNEMCTHEFSLALKELHKKNYSTKPTKKSNNDN